MNKITIIALLYLTLIVGFFFRISGIDWDQGHHMHPDERAIVLSVVDLSFPTRFSEFFSPESPWNPQFFAYGSFPFYLLRIAGDVVGTIDPLFAEYDRINILGRFLSALFDNGTIIVIYFIGKHLKNRLVGLLSSMIYALSVLPIQLSHFFAVDTLLTFFLTLTLFVLLKLYEKPSLKNALFIGISFGLALDTKISATVIISSISLAFLLDFLLIFLKSPHRFSIWKPHLTPLFKRIMTYGVIIICTVIMVFAFFQPYAFIDSERFMKHLQEQSHMTKDAFTFPYTFQYVGKIPYLYELTNIFLFGMGPVIGTVSFLGFLYCLYRVVYKTTNFPWQKTLILLQFFITYFLITGSFAIGFMRYMLPLYPLLCLFAGILLYTLLKKYPLRKSKLYAVCYMLFAILLLTWPLSFMSIYFTPNTKIQATAWMLQNIPAGKTLATEHWDDTLPLTNQHLYAMKSLPMYEPDTKEKWKTINEILNETDYIVIASNRLYAPLMKLTDCTNLPANRCYLRTSIYYKELFEETSGFTKVAEFTSFPTLPLTNITFNDQSADESFTVYDHPKIMIFQKTHE